MWWIERRANASATTWNKKWGGKVRSLRTVTMHSIGPCSQHATTSDRIAAAIIIIPANNISKVHARSAHRALAFFPTGGP